jgi:hypothetical protein
MIGSRVAASLFATVCMYVTTGLVDVSAIPKTHVSLSGRLPLWYLDLWLNRLSSICTTTPGSPKSDGVAKSFTLVIDFISRLPLAKLVYLMYLWSGETTVKSAAWSSASLVFRFVVK